MCKLSIIIPVYNTEEYVIQLLSSLYNQTDVQFKDYEIIVVNDGSTDNTLINLLNFIKVNKEFKLKVYSQENSGVSYARNKGLQKAQGRYIWFIDADDIVTKNAIKDILYIINNHDVDVIRMGYPIYNKLDHIGLLEDVYYESNLSDYNIIDAFELLSGDDQLGHQRYIWRKTFLQENYLKYPENISNNEDYLFLIKSITKAGKAYVNNTVRNYVYRSLAVSLSRGNNDFARIDKHISNRLFVLSELIKYGKENIDIWNEVKNNAYNRIISQLKMSICFNVLLCDQSCFVIKYYLKRLKVLLAFPYNEVFYKEKSWRHLIFRSQTLFVIVSQLLRINFVKPLIKRFNL